MIDTADGDSPKQILTIYHGFEISSLSVLQFLASSAETAQVSMMVVNVYVILSSN